MRIIIVSILLLLSFSVSAWSQKATEKTANTKEGEEVLATVSKWADAVRSRDYKALDELFAEDLIVTTFDGTTRGKQEELRVLQPKENLRTASVNNEDVKVRVFGQAAVVTGLVKMHFVISEKDARSAFRYTAVFVKEDGRWRIVAVQTANAPKEQK